MMEGRLYIYISWPLKLVLFRISRYPLRQVIRKNISIYSSTKQKYRIAALHISTLMQLLLDGTWFECLEESKFVAKRVDWKRNWISEWMCNAKCRNRYIKPKPKQYLYFLTIRVSFCCVWTTLGQHCAVSGEQLFGRLIVDCRSN